MINLKWVGTVIGLFVGSFSSYAQLLYVSSYAQSDNYISVFDANTGALVQDRFISTGGWDTNLSLDSTNRHLYVANVDGSGVSEFDALSGQFLAKQTWGGLTPRSLAFDSAGYMYGTAFDGTSTQVVKIDAATGTIVTTTNLNTGYFGFSKTLLVGDTIWVTTWDHISFLRADDLSLIRTISSNEITAITYADSSVYAIDVNHDWVQVWDADSMTLTNVGLIKHPAIRDFPLGIAIDGNDRILVAVTGSSADVIPALRLFDQSGKSLDDTFVVPPWPPNQVVYSPLHFNAVPEPSTYGLIGSLLLLGTAALQRRRLKHDTVA